MLTQQVQQLDSAVHCYVSYAISLYDCDALHV
jgi:hypothetical protein